MNGVPQGMGRRIGREVPSSGWGVPSYCWKSSGAGWSRWAAGGPRDDLRPPRRPRLLRWRRRGGCDIGGVEAAAVGGVMFQRSSRMGEVKGGRRRRWMGEMRRSVGDVSVEGFRTLEN